MRARLHRQVRKMLRVFLGHRPCGEQSGWGNPDLLPAGPWDALNSINSMQMRRRLLDLVAPSWEEAKEAEMMKLGWMKVMIWLSKLFLGGCKNRLLVLQERATEAIKALPVACREDWEYGMVETRVWGLEALRHVLRMRLALQSTLMLCKPVGHEPENPPSVELLAATLTLNIHNKGNR